MSAAEKLKTLDFGTTVDDAEVISMGYEALLALRDALPQIVAVVEAAEQTEEHPNLGSGTNRICKICGYDLNFEGARNRRSDGHGPDCALAALDEALGDVT